MINYQNIFKNKNKLVYVVGGSGRIGSEIIVALSSSGAKTIVLDIKKKKCLKKKLLFSIFWLFWYTKLVEKFQWSII